MRPSRPRSLLVVAVVLALVSCRTAPSRDDPGSAPVADYYGTLEPFVSEAVYFVVTDRFVNGDPDNDHRDQGGEHPSFDIALPECDGVQANIGYLGGDFRGLLDNADYIAEMGFSAVWITPIVDNPDQAFTGGDPITCTSFLTDRGKAGYHGYWGVNFYRLDEHLPSPGLDFAALTRGLRGYGLKTVLDIVANHGSPAWTMPQRQPGFGQIFDAGGSLLADHQNLPPDRLDPAREPLHRFYNTEPDLAQLGDFDPDNPQVMDYLVGAYLQWVSHGADAFRIDTVRHQPAHFWREFITRIRAEYPDFFFFGEAFDYEIDNIAPYTWPEAGGMSLLDFPLKAAMMQIFESPDSDYATVLPALYLDEGPWWNPYELAIFYDNHDMARLNASDDGFIDAHNFLFTTRGFPVVYYGSEAGFMRGRAEHAGNRNYFGQAGIDAARGHPIRERLARIARVRAQSPALQRGLQLNLEFAGHRAAFYRVYQRDEIHQTALVLLNKGDEPVRFELGRDVQPGYWRNAFNGSVLQIDRGKAVLPDVPAHDVAVWLLDAPVTEPALRTRLDRLMASARPLTNGG